MKKHVDYGHVEWDCKTITAEDYTIEFKILPEFYNDYIEKEKDQW